MTLVKFGVFWKVPLLIFTGGTVSAPLKPDPLKAYEPMDVTV